MPKVGTLEGDTPINMNYNKFSKQTAIGIVTCDRPEFFKKLLDSIDPYVGSIYVVNAGKDFEVNDDKVTKYIKTQNTPTAVGRAKNQVLREMRHDGYEYLFLIEDDVLIKDNAVFEQYILTAAETGLWAGQLCYGSHGGVKGGNVKEDGTPNLIDTIEYENFDVDLYPQSFQAFTLYHANVFKIIGYFDEYYENAAEHLDHYTAAFANGLGNYFWYFPDISESWTYIEDQDKNHEESVIRKNPEWKDNMTRAWNWFYKKYGVYPDQMKKAEPEKVLERLTFIEDNYSKKELLNE